MISFATGLGRLVKKMLRTKLNTEAASLTPIYYYMDLIMFRPYVTFTQYFSLTFSKPYQKIREPDYHIIVGQSLSNLTEMGTPVTNLVVGHKELYREGALIFILVLGLN